MERERIREPEAVANSDYDKTIRHYQEWAERQRTGSDECFDVHGCASFLLEPRTDS